MDWTQIVLIISALTSFGSTVWTFAVMHTNLKNLRKDHDDHVKNCREDKNKIWDKLDDKVNK